MVFSSASFLLFFLPCLLVCYFVVPRRMRGLRNLILLGFSLAFYTCGGPKFLLLMLLSIAINYACGRLAGPEHPLRVRKAGVLLACVLGLGLLGWFKYAGFFGEILHALAPVIPVPQVTLPIGISFFTFQGLSYVIDVYRCDAAVQKNPLKVALYISFFPQLVAGPIVRYTTVAAEIDARRESVEEFSAGAVRFLFGLGKKMLLANAVAEVADAAFAAASPSAAFAWLGAVAYTFQIYFDFSAYSDMAIGLGRMFGFMFVLSVLQCAVKVHSITSAIPGFQTDKRSILSYRRPDAKKRSVKGQHHIRLSITAGKTKHTSLSVLDDQSIVIKHMLCDMSFSPFQRKLVQFRSNAVFGQIDQLVSQCVSLGIRKTQVTIPLLLAVFKRTHKCGMGPNRKVHLIF